MSEFDCCQYDFKVQSSGKGARVVFQETSYLLGKERPVSARSWLALRWRHNSMLMMHKGTNFQTGKSLIVSVPVIVAFLNIIHEFIKAQIASFFTPDSITVQSSARVKTRALKYLEQSFEHPHIILTANVFDNSYFF